MRINNSIVNNNFKKLDGKQIICGNNPEAFAFLTWLLKSPYTEDVFAASQTLLTFCIIYKWFRRVRGPAETQTKDVLCIGNPLVVSSYYFSNWFGFFIFAYVRVLLDYEQSLLFLVRRAKLPGHANDHARDWRRACTPHIKSEKEKRDCSQSSVLLVKNVIINLVL